jgi:hypothetical protein
MESRASLVFRHLLKGEKRNTYHNVDNGVIAFHEAAPFDAISFVLLIWSQQPIAAHHLKSTNESTMSVTAQMVNLAIPAITTKHPRRQTNG